MHMFYVTDMCPAKNICDTRDILKISSLKLGAQRIAICKMDTLNYHHPRRKLEIPLNNFKIEL